MLRVLLLLPLFGALIVALLPGRNPDLIRRATLAAATRERTRGALASGALLPIATRQCLHDAGAMRFVVRGVTVAWNAATRFDSGSTSADIRVGRRVEVKGRLSADGLLIEATSVHIES